ncbi:MAG TPA: PRC-barrel domain-containing protein [Microvirga sp.]|nr:PRC-barrel domain-containing protein [Microvirga sp.]
MILLNQPSFGSTLAATSIQKVCPMRSLAVMSLAVLGLGGMAHAQSTPPASSATQFITISNNAILSSRLIGLDVQNASGSGVGKIEDIVLEGGQIVGIVLSVGEVLGSGQRYVAVDPSSVSIRYTEAQNKWQATMNANLEQLKSAPEFRYEGKWRR